MSDETRTGAPAAWEHRLHRLKLMGLQALSPLIHGERTRHSRRLGVTLSLDTDHYIDYLIYVQGYYEEETLRAIDDAMSEWGGNAQFVDVGANMGLMCTYVAAHYPGSRVVAFEPLGEFAARIRVQQGLNDVTFPIEELALSDREGMLNLFPPNEENRRAHWGKSNPGMTSAHPDASHQRNGIEVRCAPLDLLVQKTELIRADLPTFVKLDVEGHEVQALKGMLGFLGEGYERRLAVELLTSRHPELAQRAWDLLASLGFSGASMGRRRLSPCDRPQAEGMYLFTRR